MARKRPERPVCEYVSAVLAMIEVHLGVYDGTTPPASAMSGQSAQYPCHNIPPFVTFGDHDIDQKAKCVPGPCRIETAALILMSRLSLLTQGEAWYLFLIVNVEPGSNAGT